VWSKKAVFQKYLSSLKNCDKFMDEAHAKWLISLSQTRKRKIYNKLKELDPEGYEKLVYFVRSITRKRVESKKRIKHHTNEITQKALERDLIALANSVPPEENHGVETFKYVQANTVLEMIAALMASGYTKDEIVKRTSFSMDLINAVTPEHVITMKRMIPEAILDALEQKIYKDLTDTGVVTLDMERADRMVSRRRKNYMDAAKIGSDIKRGQALRKLDSKVLEDKHKSRFGSIIEGESNENISSE
jgi:hypothetical protein